MIRLLLVDDHAVLREPLAIMLAREADLTVVGQAESIAAARALIASGVEVDIALVDLRLIDGHGADLIHELRQTSPRTISLVVTGMSDRREHARAIEAGAAHIIDKSVTISEIADAIRRLSAGEVLLDPQKAADLLRLADELQAQSAAEAAAVARLTPRELEVLRLLAQGLDNQGIAEQMHVGLETARTHVANVLSKLGATSRLQAVLLAHRHGIISFE